MPSFLNITDTARQIGVGPTHIRTIEVFNNHTSDPAYLKLYDKASAATTSDTPVWRMLVPPLGGAGRTYPERQFYSLGLSARATTGVADDSADAPASNQIILNVN
jgi:hypothetical protein